MKQTKKLSHILNIVVWVFLFVFSLGKFFLYVMTKNYFGVAFSLALSYLIAFVLLFL